MPFNSTDSYLRVGLDGYKDRQHKSAALPVLFFEGNEFRLFFPIIFLPLCDGVISGVCVRVHACLPALRRRHAWGQLDHRCGGLGVLHGQAKGNPGETPVAARRRDQVRNARTDGHAAAGIGTWELSSRNHGSRGGSFGQKRRGGDAFHPSSS